MVNTRATNYDNKEQDNMLFVFQVNDHDNEYYENEYYENEYCAHDTDSDYVPSADESVDSYEIVEEEFSEHDAAKALVSLKEPSKRSNKRKRCDSDSDSDYEPEDESDSDEEYIGGIKCLRGMPKPCGVHIRFD